MLLKNQRKPQKNCVCEYITAIENNEKIDFPKTVVAYRDNDLYSKYMPVFIDKLKSDGREVIELVTPREVEYSSPEIQKELSRNNDRIYDFSGGDIDALDIISDDTMGEYFKDNFSLDRVFNDVSQKSLLQLESNLNGYEKKDFRSSDTLNNLSNIKKFMDKVIDINGSPNQVYIAKNNIADHDFDNYMSPIMKRTIRGYDEAEKEKAEKELNIEYEEFAELNNLDTNTLRSLENFDTDGVSSVLKGLLSEYIASENIHIVDILENFPTDDSTMVVLDRHYLNKNPEVKNRLQIQLPVESGLEYAAQNNLLNLDFDFEKELENEINTTINLEHFVKKVKIRNNNENV